MTTPPPTAAAARLTPALEVLRANAVEADRTGELPRENMDALRAAGAFRWSLASALGGDELSWTEKAQLSEALGRADLCTTWLFFNYDSHTWDLSKYAEEPFPGAAGLLRAETAFCGTVAPVRGSVAGGDEIVVNGRFGFVTGWGFATWMRSIVLLPGPDPEGGDPAAKFHARLVHFPLDRPEVNVERTWDAAGLRASQTDTVAVEGLRIPRSHAIHGQSDEVRDEPARRPRSAHYAQPGWALSNARIGLALAGCAAEAFDLAVAHTTGGRANQGGAPARFPGVRYAMAEAFVELQAARMAQYGVAAAADARAQAAVNPTAADVLQVLATGMASTQTVLRAIDQLSLALGATGTQRALPFERLFRDIRTGALHLGVHPSLVRERVAGYLFPGPG